MSGDVEELDSYVLGAFESLQSFDGICIAVVNRLHDNDDKLRVVPEGKHDTDDQIDAYTEYLERFFDHTLIKLRYLLFSSE